VRNLPRRAVRFHVGAGEHRRDDIRTIQPRNIAIPTRATTGSASADRIDDQH
jgi:hypothetical protein